MADPVTFTPRPRRRWLRRLAWLFGALFLLLVIAWFGITSSAFFKSVILPRVGKAINADVTVSDASISPFSQVTLRNLKLQTRTGDPVLFAREVRARYSLMDILHGNLHVDELTLASPTVVLMQNADGTSNYGPLLQGQTQAPQTAKPQPSTKASRPVQLDVKKFALNDATIRYSTIDKSGNRSSAELSQVNLTLDDLKNGQPARLQLSADIRSENHPAAPAAASQFQAKLKADLAVTPAPDLKSGSVKGRTHCEITQADGPMSDLSGLGADLDCEVTPTDLKQAVVQFQKGASRLGQIRAHGPFDMQKNEGRLTLEIAAIDKQVLNLAAARFGIDFGTTTLDSTNDIQLAKSGALIAVAGRLGIDKFQLIRTNQATPPLDFHAQYNVTLDRSASNAVLRELTFTGTRQGKALLEANLARPMTLPWGGAAGAVGDSSLKLTVTGLDLSDWRPFLGGIATAGNVSAKLDLLSEQGGKQLTFDLNAQADRLTAGVGTNQITQAAVTLLARGQASDLSQFNLSQYELKVAQQNQPMLTVAGSGTYNRISGDADQQLTLQVSLARLLQVVPQPDIQVSAGNADVKVHLTQKVQTPPAGQPANTNRATIAGTVALADFSGRIGKNDFNKFGLNLDLAAERNGPQIQVSKASGKLMEGAQAGGTFDLTAAYNSADKSCELTAKLNDFNQNGLRPFLETMLADKKLVSVALNGQASLRYNPRSESTLKAELRVANLVVNDPSHRLPATALEASVKTDASLKKDVADVRQFELALTPTSRATNALRLNGQVDFADTNAIKGNVKLVADSLDLTPYYDLFTSATNSNPGGKTAGAAPAARPSAARAAATNAAPAGSKLPFSNFIAGLDIRRLYLHDIEVADLQAAAKLNGPNMGLDTFKLLLNGAPISANAALDLGVPGCKYDFALDAKDIPLAPLVDSLQPQDKNQVHGTLTAHAKIKGTGTTGASLQKTLAGQFDLSSTNLNLSIANVRNHMLKALLEVVVVIPDLAQNPSSTLTSLAQGALGGKSGGSEELKKSPIDAIILRGVAGSGRIDFQQAVVQSPSFRADAAGTITLADDLDNSPIQIPVSISLERSVAQRLTLLPADTPTNAPYAKLPDFLTLRGTVTKVQQDVNKKVLAGTAFQKIGAALGGDAGNILQKLGGAFGGNANAGQITSTNQPGTNQPANRPGTNQPAASRPATNQSPVNELLDLFGPKKK